MSKPAKSMFFFGVYVVIAGLGFLIIPNTLLSLLGLQETTEPWIRILGFIALILGYYYIRISKLELKEFYAITVPARASVMLVFTGMVVLNIAPPIILLFGFIDLLGAIWTWSALKEKPS